MVEPHLIEIYPHVWRRLVDAEIAHPADVNALLLIILSQLDAERIFNPSLD